MPEFVYLKDGLPCTAYLPVPAEEVLAGVLWDDPCALFSPAYWYTQYLMARCEGGREPVFRIATTLYEEVTACLLGGHGIAAEIAMAAFARLRDDGLIASLCTDRALLERALATPLTVGERSVRYRFFAQKAKYLTAIYRELRTCPLHVDSASLLRRELLALPGIGPKTASFIVRNWLGSNDVAILDIHIVRAGILAGLYSVEENVQRDYEPMENRFVAFARGLGVPTSSLDVLMWSTMRQTPRLVRSMLAKAR